jgi:hypothetical protein
MPIFKAGGKLVYYAHVPKCGGSAVGWYLTERFGPIAFEDRNHTRHDAKTQWSRTSPQHIDRVSLGRLFPEGFFDAAFTIVRHPVARLVSAYHFQAEVEKIVPATTGFSEWLEDLADRRRDNPFVFDNHVRPMTEIVPDGAMVFHMEHGLDALVPWFDALTGTTAAPRALPRINERGTYAAATLPRAEPSEWDMKRIVEIYGEDFSRFGYAPDRKVPMAPPPILSPDLIAERDTALKAFNNPVAKLTRKISRRIGL